jgi:anion transporter
MLWHRMLSIDKRLAGILLSVVLCSTAFVVTAGSSLTVHGRLTLVMVLFAVTWWAFSVVPPAFTSLILIVVLLLTGIGGAQQVLGFWAGPMAWLMVGAFLIARAVTESGLAKRISLVLMKDFLDSYTALVAAIYILNALLALVVPLPFPRAFLIMALVREIIERAELEEKTAAVLGFAVFAGSVPGSMMFLTGEAVLNPITASFAGGISWLGWFTLMFVPSVAAGLLMFAAHMVVFPVQEEVAVKREYLLQELQELGRFSGEELRTLFWVGAALLFWMTDSWHGIHPGWVALAAAAGMALPWVGGVLGEQDIVEGVDWPVLLFATGALAVGTVGTATGLAEWLVARLVPASLPQSAVLLLFLVGVAGFVLHLFIGSVLATLSMLVPAVVAFAVGQELPAFAPPLIIYTTAVMGFALPFHNLMILVGAGETGGFSERETLRFFPAQTLVTLLVVALEIAWWVVLGRV